jgi:hypothetical protein
MGSYLKPCVTERAEPVNRDRGNRPGLVTTEAQQRAAHEDSSAATAAPVPTKPAEQGIRGG